MLSKSDLGQFIIDCLKQNNGRATLIDVSKYIWKNHEDQLKQSGDLFYTWQYDYRWQATELRKKGVLKEAGKSKYWELA
ncbi:hypothetical protein [Paenibacillus polymyxa]|uniref:hypothetical protein n=1 Tax=Paenibacillus polymyxa TaxID=1406 RepID=UPI0021E3E4E3|nr:hypothetical protein [Paenibacillus polymyxa]